MSTGKVLLGVVAGAAAGAALGILFAPDKGSITRKKISDSGEDFIDEVKDKFSDLIESTKDKFTAAKNEAEKIIEKNKFMAHDVNEEIKNEIN